MEVKVTEEQVEENRVGLSASWLAGNLIGLKAPSGRDRGVEECIELQRMIDGIDAEVRQKVEASAVLVEEQDRLMKLIPNGHGEQANAWRTDLASAEKGLRALKRAALPELRERLKEAQEAIRKALLGLRYRWSDDAEGGTTAGGPAQPPGAKR